MKKRQEVGSASDALVAEQCICLRVGVEENAQPSSKIPFWFDSDLIALCRASIFAKVEQWTMLVDAVEEST